MKTDPFGYRPPTPAKPASDVLPELEALLRKVQSLEWVRFGKTAGELERLLDQLRQAPELAERYPLALVSVPVPPGVGEVIKVCPQLPVSLEHVVVAPACERFRFCLTWGRTPTAVTSDFLPASCFLSNAHSEALDHLFAQRFRSAVLPVCAVITCHVFNDGPVVCPFEAVAWVRVGR